MFQVHRSPPLTNAERQARWREKHRPRKRKAFKPTLPDGTPLQFGADWKFQTRPAPMTNAERQARWRAKHRPKKPHLQWRADGFAYLVQPSAPF